eukprot:366225-Chlamydomonas_euryale.AAC.10
MAGSPLPILHSHYTLWWATCQCLDVIRCGGRLVHAWRPTRPASESEVHGADPHRHRGKAKRRCKKSQRT